MNHPLNLNFKYSLKNDPWLCGSLNTTNKFTLLRNWISSDYFPSLEKVSNEDMRLLLVCGDNRGRREMRSLFMQFLSLDISACVVVGDQILRDRVWQVQQSRFAAGTFCFAPMLRTLLCRTAWLLANSVNRSAAVFLGHGPD